MSSHTQNTSEGDKPAPEKDKKPAESGDAVIGSGSDLFVVGLGASAGGIHALKSFFSNVPDDSGIAYVVILHISPDYESSLAEVIQADSRIPVEQVSGLVEVKPDHVYVVSPNHSLSMLDGHIDAKTLNGIAERRAPIDMFFGTLAESHRDRAACVILSGTGADGSMGLKRIKERGGAAFVQDPAEAEFNEMPGNAIATDLIDAVLPAAEIPAKIAAYKRRITTLESEADAERQTGDSQQNLRDIFTLPRVRTGHEEELQPVNEEPITVDQELKLKVDELSQFNNDFRNLINSTDIATIFLDHKLRVKYFSPRSREAFSLLDSDLGSPLTDLHSRLEYSELKADAETVLNSRQMIEKDVRSTDGKTFLMRLTPYRTAEDRTNGVVIALFDISKRVRAEEELRAAHAEVIQILESMSDAFFTVDRDWKFIYLNQRAERFLDRTRNELLGKSVWKVFPEDEEPELFKKMREAAASKSERSFKAFSPKLSRWIEVNVFPAAAGDYLYFRDITEGQRREENLAFLAEINSDLAGD